MGKIFDHTEVTPSLGEDEECLYLPMFGVFHLQKTGQIRMVSDSSVCHSAVSLSDVLLTSPELNNSPLGLLIQFWKEKVAILADKHQMFHCFLVQEDHRNYLRFLWHKDNDVTEKIINYRMS